MSEKTCYNYGTNLNEIPNYAHFNFFLAFLYPDMSNIFLISFFCLNGYLLMFFFDYNHSLARQFIRGFIYFCISNFVLFSIWLLTVNSTCFSIAINQFLNWLIHQTRFLFLFNQITQKLTAYLRFIVFYYVYINPVVSLVLYIVTLVIYYQNTKMLFFKREKKNLLTLLSINNEIVPKIYNTEFQSNTTSLVNDDVIEEHPIVSSINNDIDLELSELIDQINGVTTIWLPASSRADRLISDLPCVEYCKCYYMNRVKVRHYNETETETDDRGESTEDDEKPKEENSNNKISKLYDVCQCGKNTNLKNDLKENDFIDIGMKFRQECSICLEKYKFGCLMIVLPCSHSFHRNCVYQWFMNSVNYKLNCPNCRSSFNKFKKTI